MAGDPRRPESAGAEAWEREWRAFVESGEDMRVQEVIDDMKLGHLRVIINGHTVRCLEVGCGTGSLSARLAALGHRTTCLDFSPLALALARKRYRRAALPGSFAIGDAFRLPFRGSAFDVVLSTGLLEHFPDPRGIVSEMSRALRPGGVFFSDVWPAKFSLFRAFEGLRVLKRRCRGQGEMFERAFDEAAIRELLEGAGLGGVRIFPAGVFPPVVPLLFRLRGVMTLYAWLLRKSARTWMRLDGSVLAGRLGCYYVAVGFKPDGSPGPGVPQPPAGITARR